MTRPRIWKEPRFGGRPWCATHPDKPETWRLCETWQEAVEYVADALRNPLPMEMKDVWGEHLTVTYDGSSVFITDERDDDQIILARHNWRLLARALARLAEKEGVK